MVSESMSQKKSPAPTIEEVEDVDIRPRGNLPPKNPNHILEASDEEMMPAPKEVTAGPSKIRRKKLKAKSTVVKSSDDEPEVTVTKKDKHNSLQNADGDTDIEEVPNPKENPEEELGELSIASQFMPVTYQDHHMLKNEWQKIGRHPFTAFSSRAPKSKLLTVDVAMSSSVPRHFAREKARNPEW